jgi:hypothetical protein
LYRAWIAIFPFLLGAYFVQIEMALSHSPFSTKLAAVVKSDGGGTE